MARIDSPKLNEFLIDFFHQFDDASHLQLDDFISRTPGLQAPENAVRFHHGNPSPGSSAWEFFAEF